MNRSIPALLVALIALTACGEGGEGVDASTSELSRDIQAAEQDDPILATLREAPAGEPVIFTSTQERPLDRLKESAEAGDPWAMAYFGRLYYLAASGEVPLHRGRRDSIDSKIRIKVAFLYGDLFAKREDGAHHRADFVECLGLQLFQPKMEVAIEWLRRSARLSNPDALHLLGEIHFYGDGVPEDGPRANAFQTAAVERGSPEAAVRRIDELYRVSEGDEHHARIFELAQEAASTGVPRGSLLLAVCHRDGLGTLASGELALQTLEEGADRGCTSSMSTLACALDGVLEGWSVEVDNARAQRLFIQAGRAGDANALNMLFLGHRERRWGHEHAAASAFQFAQLGAQLDSPMGARNLAECYTNGIGAPRDYGNARSLYRDAALGGDLIGALNLASFLRNGSGGPVQLQGAYDLLGVLLEEDAFVPEDEQWVIEEARSMRIEVEAAIADGMARASAPEGLDPSLATELEKDSAGRARSRARRARGRR